MTGVPSANDGDLDGLIAVRGIEEVLHFTTNRGVLGVLATGLLKSRARLPEDKYLEYIFEPNAIFRKDRAWLDYVNMSISAINGAFFEICANKWHRGEDMFWVSLSFDPSVMTHDQVLFVTTNNMYSGASRRSGVSGCSALFAERIERWPGAVVTRRAGLDQRYPTDEQAEVLYPGELSTSYLRRIYVASEHAFDVVAAQLALFPHEDVEVVLDPSLRRRN